MLVMPLETTRKVHEQEWSQLIALTAQGDQAALARLYDRASPQIYGLVLKILDTREAAEERLHDAVSALGPTVAILRCDPLFKLDRR